MSAFVDRERGRFGVEPICRELEVSSRAYRQRRGGNLSRRGQRDLVLLEEIRRAHAESDESYGSWRCWKQLNRDGTTVARCTVERLMRQERLIGVVRGKTQRTTTPGSSSVPAADLVKRCFTASRPDELWVADFTYVRTWEGWAYLAIVLDVYSRRIVGWQLASHMRESLVDDALQMAIASRTNPAAPLVAHTDNGSQYTAWGYSQRLADAGIVPSRGRTGTALDNAMAEERDRDDQDRTDQETRLEDTARPRARVAHLHRLVQPAQTAPLTRRQHPERDRRRLPARHRREDRIR